MNIHSVHNGEGQKIEITTLYKYFPSWAPIPDSLLFSLWSCSHSVQWVDKLLFMHTSPPGPHGEEKMFKWILMSDTS